MKRSCFALALGMLALLGLTGSAWAQIRLEIPEDVTPPFYHSTAGPLILDDGSIFAIHDDAWAAIPFYRSPEYAPLDHDLLSDFDPNVFDAPLHVEGFIELTDEGQLFTEHTQGLGTVPIWFLRWSELQALMADGDLTMLELRSAVSLRTGTAEFYRHENHVFGVHPVSHLTIVSRGTLSGGGTFELNAIEVGLELKYVRIEFE